MPLPGGRSLDPETQARIDELADRVGRNSVMAHTDQGDIFMVPPVSVEKMDFADRVADLEREFAAKSAEATKGFATGGIVQSLPTITIDPSADPVEVAKRVIPDLGRALAVGVKHKPALSLACCHKMLEIVTRLYRDEDGAACSKQVHIRICYHCGAAEAELGEEEDEG